MNIKEFIGTNSYYRYPNGTQLTHEKFYSKVIEKLGGLDAVIPYIPFTLEEIKESLPKDKHLNNLGLCIWERAAGFDFKFGKSNIIGGGIIQLYRTYGINVYSCSDGVSILKNAAILWAKRPGNKGNNMERTFNFGKIDYYKTGTKSYLVTVEVSYEEKGDKKVFSASGNIWDKRHSDIICGGQCLDTLNEYLKGDETFDKIYHLWKFYHLNDMHAECEHQRELGWKELAREQIYLYHWSLNVETIRQQDDIKKLALNAVKKGETFIPTEEQSRLYNLDYKITTENDELSDELKQYYEPSDGICFKHVEIKNAGHVYEKDHSKGILCKPCPVCGYKYGSSWLYEPIPVEDEKIIYELLEGE